MSSSVAERKAVTLKSGRTYNLKVVPKTINLPVAKAEAPVVAPPMVTKPKRQFPIGIPSEHMKAEDKLEEKQNKFILDLMIKFFNDPMKYMLKKFVDDKIAESGRTVESWYDLDGNTIFLNKGSKELEGYNSGYSNFHYRIFDGQTRIIWNDSKYESVMERFIEWAKEEMGISVGDRIPQ